MGIIDACCWGPFGSKCCNIISLLGFIYFGFNVLIFERQKNFYEFHMQNPSATRTSMLVTAILYLIVFFITLARVIFLNKSQKVQKKHMHSIHENPKKINTVVVPKPKLMREMDMDQE